MNKWMQSDFEAWVEATDDPELREAMLRDRVAKLTIHSLNQTNELRRLNKSVQRKVHAIKRLREEQRDSSMTSRFPLIKLKPSFSFKNHGTRRMPELNPASTKAKGAALTVPCPHKSDCAVHGGPAYDPRPCNCGHDAAMSLIVGV